MKHFSFSSGHVVQVMNHLKQDWLTSTYVVLLRILIATSYVYTAVKKFYVLKCLNLATYICVITYVHDCIRMYVCAPSSFSHYMY